MFLRSRRLLVGTVSSTTTATTTTATAAAATSSSPAIGATENERSFLRHLIPLRVQGSGAASHLLRHAFLQQHRLIPVFLGALEAVPLPALPRMLLAEGFQQLLDGRAPQRQLRELFEDADMECRKALLGLDPAAAEADVHAAVRDDPLRRLLMYELRGAAGYYARMMAVSSAPETSAAVLLRTLIASDVRLDPLLGKVMLAFDAHPRDAATGAPREPVPAYVEQFVKETLLLERDAFGVFRFDARGDNRMLLHCLKLDSITKTPESSAVLHDPVLAAHGCFDLTVEDVYEGRWRRYHLSCADDDLRIAPELPDLATIGVPDSVDERRRTDMTVFYNQPICHRHKATTREERGGVAHTETFELAVEDTNRTFWEKYFLDR